jgi:hypothetical protein
MFLSRPHRRCWHHPVAEQPPCNALTHAQPQGDCSCGPWALQLGQQLINKQLACCCCCCSSLISLQKPHRDQRTQTHRQEAPQAAGHLGSPGKLTTGHLWLLPLLLTAPAARLW